MANKPTIRRLTQPCTNKTLAEVTTPSNRPHASQQTPGRPGLQGPKQERRPAGWRHRHAPRLPAIIPVDATEYHNSTIMRPTNQRQQITPNPRHPGECNLNRVRRREHASRHASPVARASSSRLTPTENKPRSGLRGHKPLAPRPRSPDVDQEVQLDPLPAIFCPKERNVRTRSSMGYLSGQNSL